MAKEKKEERVFSSNKAEARKLALESIKKAHGEGAAFEFSAHPLPDVEAVSTGSLGLDVALGVGGYPRGRIIEIYGPEASGKCLTADTLILSESGLKYISEIFQENGVTPSNSTKVTPKTVRLVNRHGNLENTVALTNNGARPVFAVQLKDGSEVKSTANHPHLVMNSRGSWVWKKTQDIAVGDMIAKARKPVEVGTPEFSEDTYYALGALVADGGLTEVSRGRISFTNNDPTVIVAVLKLMESEGFTSLTYERAENNTSEFHFNGKELTQAFCTKYGLTQSRAAEKRVPAVVRSSTVGMRAFMQGYVDCECYIDSDKHAVEVCSASNTLLKECQAILLSLGVHSSLSEKRVKHYPQNEYWRLEFSGPSYRAYGNNVGFRSSIRATEFSVNETRTQTHSNNDLVVNVHGVLADLYDASETTREHSKLTEDYKADHSPTYAKLDEILSLDWAACSAYSRLKEIREAEYVYVPVESVTAVGVEPTFDFAMEETHSFVANGFVTHNTTLTLHAIAAVQKLGGSAAFVDAEHALDPKYARALGVKMDDVVLSQPESGEQALDIVETLVSSGGFDIVIVDSVAALVPQAEINGDMGDSHVGLQARLMSQALRKLTAVVSKSNTILVFINQIRMKIGVMYGSPETTTGGNALKFYASLRLEVRRIGSIKTGDDAVGNRTRVKVVKNKVAPPFREVEFDILFGKGISYTGDLVELGVTYGLIDKAGAWYSYQGERIGQGAQNVVNYLNEHPDLAATLDRAIRKQCGLKVD